MNQNPQYFSLLFVLTSVSVQKALPSITIIAPPHTVKIPNIIDLLSSTARARECPSSLPHFTLFRAECLAAAGHELGPLY